MHGEIHGQIAKLAHVHIGGGVVAQVDERLINFAFAGHAEHVADDVLLKLTDIHLANRILVVNVFFAGSREHQGFGTIKRLVVAFGHSGRIGHFDGFGHINGNAAKGINKILERRERGHQVVINFDAREALYGIHGLHGIAVHQRVVDFARLARQNRVARDRHQGELIVRRINAHQRDDIGVLIQLSMV